MPDTPHQFFFEDFRGHGVLLVTTLARIQTRLFRTVRNSITTDQCELERIWTREATSDIPSTVLCALEDLDHHKSVNS